MIYSFNNSSFRDKDTGLYNEAYFMEVFYREWHRMIREHHALSVLVVHPHIDIVDPQGFKEFVSVARLLEQSTKRTTDLVSRFHGNEFIVGLFDLNSSGTTTIIERILGAIKDTEGNSVGTNRNTFIGGLNVFPDQKVDINNVLQEVEVITNLKSRNAAEQSYDLRSYEFH